MARTQQKMIPVTTETYYALQLLQLQTASAIGRKVTLDELVKTLQAIYTPAQLAARLLAK